MYPLDLRSLLKGVAKQILIIGVKHQNVCLWRPIPDCRPVEAHRELDIVGQGIQESKTLHRWITDEQNCIGHGTPNVLNRRCQHGKLPEDLSVYQGFPVRLNSRAGLKEVSRVRAVVGERSNASG